MAANITLKCGTGVYSITYAWINSSGTRVPASGTNTTYGSVTMKACHHVWISSVTASSGYTSPYKIDGNSFTSNYTYYPSVGGTKNVIATKISYSYKVRLVKYVDNVYQTETTFTTTSQIMSETAVKNKIPSSWASSDIELKDPWFGTLSGCRYDQNEGEFTFTSTSPTINVAYTKIVVPTYNYYLRYDANGGTGGPNTQSTLGTTVTPVTFRVSSTEPTRTNYTFLGWSFDSTATAADYVSGDIVYLYSGKPDRTLYAVWKYTPKYNYYLRYDANGGTGGPNTQSTLGTTVTPVTFRVSSTEPTRTNYTFLGWSFDSTATAADYVGGDTVYLYSENPDRTLYAVWKKFYTYSYLYNANTTDTVTNMPENQSASSFETTYSFDIRGNVPTRTGYVFNGWALVSSGGGSIYSPNDPGPQLNTNKTSITLYAQWSPRTYTITVNYYDDTSEAGLSISGGGSYQYGSVATITATSRTGYAFDGWYTYISGVWTRVSANQNYDVTVTGAMTYYAKANKIAPTIPTATIEITGATSSSLSVKATLTNVLTFSDRWYLCISATGKFEAGTYTSIEASEQPFSYTFTGLSANTTYYFKVMNFYNGQYGWQVQATTGTTLRNTFSWDFNNNLDNRRPTTNEWLRLITFIERKFGKTVSQEAKNSVVIGGTLSASLFNELAIDIGYASTVGRGTTISRAILYNLQNEVNR